MSESKIKAVHLTKWFGDLHVIDDISFEIPQGAFVCLVGPTGCGKTTVLNLLTRIYSPTSGDLYIDGEPADPVKHNISFAFQEPSSMPWLTVEGNLKFGLKVKKLPKHVINERIERVLDLLGLREFRNAYPHQLSVSVEQRVIIGRAFVTYPDLLLMDEPFGQMDIKMRFYLEDEVLKLWREFNSTVLFITHNIDEAVYLAQHILVMSNKPTTIKESLDVELPRPRDITSEGFVNLRRHVTDLIKWW